MVSSGQKCFPHSLTTTLITAEMVTKANGDKAILEGDDLKSFLQFVLGNNSLK